MGLFDRFRSAGPKPETTSGRAAPAADADAAQHLIAEGNALEDKGRFREALGRYDAAIRRAPDVARAHLNRGNALLALGDADAATAAYATALLRDPGYAAAHYNLGNAHVRAGRRDEALSAYRKALELKADFADAEVALGALCEDLGQPAEAAACYRRALQIVPAYAAVHCNLGNVLRRLGEPGEAIAGYRRALELDPQMDAAHFGLAGAQQDAKQFADAVESYRLLLLRKPDFAQAHGDLGNALQAMGRNEEAAASYRRALQLVPNTALLHVNLGNALVAAGKIHESLDSFRAAVEIEPDLAIAHYNLGNALHDLNRLLPAEASYRQALRLDPDYADAHCMLGNLLIEEQGRLHEALRCFQSMLRVDPENPVAHNNVGNALWLMGRTEAAAASYEKARTIEPDLAGPMSNLLFIHNSLADLPAADLLAQARRFGDLAARQARPFTSWANSPVPDRPLRVGLVSGDFRAHPVGYFLKSALAALVAHAPGSLQLHGYYTNTFADEVTQDIKASFSVWRPVASLTDAMLAQRIRDDEVDILIDLSGHTAFNRLQMFAWKPAPVQATWLGYLATTGVAAIDWLIADEWTLPASEETHFTENVWRLPESYLCFTPPAQQSEIGPLPALRNQHVTFGSFNNLTKLNEGVVELWSRVLAAVPDSRLFLKSKQFSEAAVRQDIAGRFARHGIDKGRLIMEGQVPRADYLKSFQRVDIALDPFPYPGITTSVETLWMGVPLLTLAGRSFMARQGVGLLTNAGLQDWIAGDPDDYVARAQAGAADLPRLAALREALRQRVLDSPIFDADRFAGNLGAALRGMWERWCAGQGARGG